MPTPTDPIATAAVVINDAALSTFSDAGPALDALSDRLYSLGWSTLSDHVRGIRAGYDIDVAVGRPNAGQSARRALTALSASLVAPAPLPAAVRLADSIDW